MKNDLIIKNDNLNNEQTYCSLICKSTEERKQLFNALEKADVLLNDVVGTEINLKDVYIDKYTKIDESTGEQKNKCRILLFDENGQTYATGSFGIFNVLGRIFQAFGTPNEWNEPLKVKVIKKEIGNNKKMLSLEIL